MKNDRSLLKAILWAGIVVGTLDILAAIIQTLIYGRNPLGMLQYIASGIFGEASFSGGYPFAVYGLIFHYGIAFGWTVCFFLIYPKMNLLSKNKFLTGFVYGLFVWLIMNRVVLPLSNVPSAPFNLARSIMAMLILVCAIGLPLSFLGHRYYTNKR